MTDDEALAATIKGALESRVSLPLSISFGTVLTATAHPAVAFKGYGPRVHAKPEDACIDIATQELAQRWLAACPHTVPPSPSFKQIMDWIALDPDLFEAAVELIRTVTLYRRGS